MAKKSDEQRLGILVEARVNQLEKDMTKAQRTLSGAYGRMKQDSRSATAAMEADMMRGTSRINQALAVTSTRMGGYARSMASSFIGVFAGTAVVRGATALVDANTRVTNSLKVAGLEGEALTSVYDALFLSAQKNAAPLESLATLYGRVALVQGELGVSTQDLLKFTDNVSLALRVAGTDAQTASGALLQLSQAMGSGVVRAEEFNSILEGATPIAQAAAAGLKEAGGSVAKLRQLVVDGKVSSEAFFAAFQAGSVILEEKVAGAELTTSQALIRLQNVLQDAAGKFNDATGASSSFAGTIDSVATSVESLSNSKILSWLGRLNNMLQDTGFLQLDSSMREINAILGFLDGLVPKADEAAASAAEVEAQLMNMLAAIVGVSDASMLSPELAAQFTSLIARAEAGTLEATELQAALVAAGGQNVNFQAIFGISQLIDKLREARGEAVALAAENASVSVSDLVRGKTPPKPVATVTPVSLDDYDKPTKPGKGSGGTKKDNFAEALRQQQERIDALNRETAARSSLNPLVDDYGYAIEKLRVQIDLENEASRAGLALTPERQAAINQLAEGYATASAAAAQLEEQQESARRSMEEWMGISQDLAKGFIGDLLDGKSATEALGNAFGRLGEQLIQMAADQAIKALFSNLFGAALGGGSLGNGIGAGISGMFGAGGLKLAGGGPVSGPGTETSDSIPAMLSDGEYVVKASAAKKNRGVLDWLNSGGEMLNRAMGGPVLDLAPSVHCGKPGGFGEVLK